MTAPRTRSRDVARSRSSHRSTKPTALGCALRRSALLFALAGTFGIEPAGFAQKVTAVAAGDNFTVFLKSDGTLWTMGQNTNGQVGYGNASIYDSQNLPVQV